METPFGNSLAATIYTGGVVPLEDSEKEGFSLAERGLKEEQALIASRVAEEKATEVPVKRKRGRPPKSEAAKKAAVATPFTVESLEEATAKLRPSRAERAQMVPEMQLARKLDPHAMVSKVDIEGFNTMIRTDLLKDICQFEKHLFKLVEKLSTGDWKLVSQAHGGIDLEYGYKLQKRMQDEGLI